ncbi:MFS transporter [Geothermobacter hydrogeniphilus]|uniref:MFS transporter n=1 Tax=Geothermobacter hydrogeniphilus TaxID=1969733 RepID=A0A2K2HDR4_9BACT|nr:MFS transporter [Geothermobacter hydrogeniphilus]PNU21437.1 MFS transporter [Geothermobacter hydrogeniphilus]
MSQIKGTSSSGLFGATLGFFFGFAAVALFGPTAGKFKAVMPLSPAQIGLLVAAPALSGSLLRIPFAAWVDTTGGRKPFLVLMVLSLLGMLGLTLVIFTRYPDGMTAGLYPLLLLLGVLCGCGIATFSVGIGQVSYWFPMSRQGQALGIYAGVGNLAPGIFSFLLPLALSSLKLGGSYLAWLLFLGLGTVLYFLTGRNAPYFQAVAGGEGDEKAQEIARREGQELFPAGSLKASLGHSARTWKTWVLVAIYFTTFGGFIAMTAWLPVYWTSYLKVSAVAAGFLTALYSILASLIRVYGGKVSDRLGGENTAIGSMAVMLAGALLMSFSAALPLSVVGEILMAVGMGVGNAAVFKLVPQEVPDAVGGAAGWVGGLGAFGGFAIPPLLGAMAKGLGSVGYARGFIIFAVLALASLLLSWLLKKTHTPRAQRA